MLSQKQLRLIKHSLEKFFYSESIRANAALLNVLHSPKTKKFEDKCKLAIKRQIYHIAEVDKINEITQRVGKALNKNLLVAVAAIWLDFLDSINGKAETIESFLSWSGSKGGQAALDKMIPPGYNFELKNLPLIDKLQHRAEFLASTVDKTGIKLTANIIHQSLEQNLSAVETAKYMRNQADLIADQRAGLITETEAAYAMSLVENETYKRNGIAKHRWITAQDERTCVECMGNEEAGAIKIDENFPSGVMAPPAHVRCRCYHLPVLPTMIEQKIWTGN